ncbi:MAG: hypothetical protein HY738_03700 [Bacteroidia bacterium]|nr:hypothetical protein [Bacteroidia bacterium]
MLWNPTQNIIDGLGNIILGGKHVIYIFGHNFDTINNSNKKKYMPAYDAGLYMADMLNDTTTLNYGASNLSYANRKKYNWLNAVWVSIPINNSTADLSDYDNIPCDVRIEIRIANPYWQGKYEYAVQPDTIGNIIYPQNNNLPMFKFGTAGLAPETNVQDVAENALDLIRIVPNPYYGHNAYELSQLDYMVKFTNLPERCDISIYTVNGTLVRRYIKDNELSYQDWNLKNEHGILISSGVYIIHINAPGIGEKVLKWIGSLRPMDMTNF